MKKKKTELNSIMFYEQIIELPKFNSRINKRNPFKILNMIYNKDRKLIVLDLDDTLIKSCLKCKKTIYISNGYYIHKRNDFLNFIRECLKNYSVAIWTRSTYNYCIPICKEIFGKYYKRLDFICCRKIDNLPKDLSLLEYLKVVIIDDNKDVCKYNGNKAIRIKEMSCYNTDNELKRVYSKVCELL